MSDLTWPKTLRGWRILFWLTLRRCPVHKCRLHIDATIYDLGGPGYCFECEGIGIWPRSGLDALRKNMKSKP